MGLRRIDGSQEAEEKEILTRLLKYADERFHLGPALDAVDEHRVQPTISTGRVMRSIMVGLFARLGSLNALEQFRISDCQLDWVGGDLPSADRLGDVAAEVNVDDLRGYCATVYKNLRRKKGIKPLKGNLRPLILDAHESFASYKRCCPACQKRVIKTANGERTQFYHRYVAAMLLYRDGCLLLDLEPLRPGEGEITAAVRLLKRVLSTCPQAFNVVSGDALYMAPSIWKLARKRDKHIVAVVKKEGRDLMRDARRIFEEMEPTQTTDGTTSSLWWDSSGFTSWPQVGETVRVVRSIETTWVRRQLTGELEEETSEWYWATSLPDHTFGTERVVAIGHQRWAIENQGFNEIANLWHADHCYKHHPIAIVAFLLLTFIAYNLFHIFHRRDIKPAFRKRHTVSYFLNLITAGLFAVPTHPPP